MWTDSKRIADARGRAATPHHRGDSPPCRLPGQPRVHMGARRGFVHGDYLGAVREPRHLQETCPAARSASPWACGTPCRLGAGPRKPGRGRAIRTIRADGRAAPRARRRRGARLRGARAAASRCSTRAPHSPPPACGSCRIRARGVLRDRAKQGGAAARSPRPEPGWPRGTTAGKNEAKRGPARDAARPG